MDGLIGYTGFVGSNLTHQTSFGLLFNSKNIDQIRGKELDLLICSGAPAVKWKANKEPGADWASVKNLMENLKHVNSKRVVLISTVDVYNSPVQVNEDTVIDHELLEPYGKHRFLLEDFIKSNFKKVHIIRLPGLFGNGLKKNVIYDFINGNSLDAIHNQSVFQFYNLERLYKDITIAMEHDLPLVNFATEPVSVRELASRVFKLDFTNETLKPPVLYNMQSKYAKLFNENSHDFYLISKKEQLEQIDQFVNMHALGELA